MKNLKVKQKLFVAFFIIAIVTAVVGTMGVVGLLTLNKNEGTLYREGVESLTGVNGMYCVIVEQRLELRGMMMNIDDMEKVNENIDKLRKREEEFIELRDLYLSASSGTDERENELMKKTTDIYDGPFDDLKDQIISALQAGNKELARDVVAQAGAAAEQATESLYEMVLYGNERAADINEQDSRTANTLIAVLMALAVIAVAIAVVFGFYFANLITKPLKKMNSLMKQVGNTGSLEISEETKRDLDKEAQGKDEIAQTIFSSIKTIQHFEKISGILRQMADGDLTAELALLSEEDTMGLSLQKMMESFNHMFSDINASSSQVSIGANQVADGSQSLAQGSTEQASSVEELSVSISEIAEKTKRNADMAKESALLSEAIKNNAEKGSRQMDNLMQAVTEINNASNSINKVIKVIDDIAFQTNILALNAAVEAARAGQHGKGFAVVADEVRNLAAKSAESAKDTSSLIEQSIEKSYLGLNIATETSDSFAEIVEGINRSTGIAAKIAQSSDDQAAAISQINMGIDQVSQVIQQNSATAEESAAASEEMSGQAAVLQELIRQFKLKNVNTSTSVELPSSRYVHKQPTLPSNITHCGSLGKY